MTERVCSSSGSLWFGGVVRARFYAPHGRYRPDVVGWLGPDGQRLVQWLVPSGAGCYALWPALSEALGRWSGALPRALAMQTVFQREQLATVPPPPELAVLGLPILCQPLVGFETALGLAGEGAAPRVHPQGYLGAGVDVPLLEALFATMGEALTTLPMEWSEPLLAGVLVPSVAPRPLVGWVGFEPNVIGMGLRFFADLDSYRDHMQAQVTREWSWEPGDDRSLLGLRPVPQGDLHPLQRQDLVRHRLQVHTTGLAPEVVAHDVDGVPRPFGRADLLDIIWLTRALCAAYRERGAQEALGEPQEVSVALMGQYQRALVWLRHPDASLQDVALTTGTEANLGKWATGSARLLSSSV